MPDQAEAAEQVVVKLREMFARTDAAPPQISPTFTPRGLERPDDGDVVADETDGASDDLRGITFAIEYTDSGGRETTRRITVQDLRQTADGRMYLHCFCHECREHRTFRFDRIRSIIDLDGVVHEPGNFFRDELNMAVSPIRPAGSISRDKRPPATRSAYSDRPGTAQRRVAQDGALLLAALARSDGIMHPAEIEVIVDYMAERAIREGIGTDQKDRLALASYLKRQRPSGESLEECLTRLGRGPTEEQRLLLRSAIALAEADGQRDTEEVTMLFNLQRRLTVEL
jgi:uncharacterized tellurite resistance protein B-like protein